MAFQDEPLPFRIEYTIFEIIMRHETEPSHFDGIGGWENKIKEKVPDAITNDVIAVFKRLHESRLIALTKGSASYVEADEGLDEKFFFVGDFRATPTHKGILYWHEIRKLKEPPKKYGF